MFLDRGGILYFVPNSDLSDFSFMTGIYVKKSDFRSCDFIYTFSGTPKPHPTQIPYRMEPNPTSWSTPPYGTHSLLFGTLTYMIQKQLFISVYPFQKDSKEQKNLERNRGSPLDSKK